MTALKDLMSVTRAVQPSSRTVTVTQNLGAVRRFSISVRRTPPRPSTRFDACLRRCAAAGIRLVVLAPADTATFARGISRFADRRADISTHVQWETAYRIFCGRGRQSHDRGSWRILAVDRDDRVIGAITGRFFCGEVQPQYLHILSLLNDTGPVFREHCELAVSEVIAAASQAGRTSAEISHWAVAPVWQAGLISATLVRAMQALVAAFDAPVIVLAADNRRSEVNRLMRLGSTPLNVDGHSCLPPFVHHESGAWLRLLVLDAAKLQARIDDTSAIDLALLRERASIISAG